MKLLDAHEALAREVPLYVVIGFQPNGQRGIPTEYRTGSHVISDEGQLIRWLKELTCYRVFRIAEEVDTYYDWEQRIKQADEDKKKEETTKHYETLKQEFDGE